jgi:hypothetical protein
MHLTSIQKIPDSISWPCTNYPHELIELFSVLEECQNRSSIKMTAPSCHILPTLLCVSILSSQVLFLKSSTKRSDAGDGIIQQGAIRRNSQSEQHLYQEQRYATRFQRSKHEMRYTNHTQHPVRPWKKIRGRGRKTIWNPNHRKKRNSKTVQKSRTL